MSLQDKTLFNGSGRLMFLTHRVEGLTELDEIRMAIEGGCSWIQLRMKEGVDRDTAREAARLCASVNDRTVRLCVDDDIEAALAEGASACHLGKNDMPVDEAWRMARERLAQDAPFYLGATANTFEDIQRAVRQGASYIGLGPYRFTSTKKKLSPILGLEGYRSIVAACREAGIRIPILAIGGITLDDVAPLMETGVMGIAVSGAIIHAADPIEATRRFIEAINIY